MEMNFPSVMYLCASAAVANATPLVFLTTPERGSCDSGVPQFVAKTSAASIKLDGSIWYVAAAAFGFFPYEAT